MAPPRLLLAAVATVAAARPSAPSVGIDPQDCSFLSDESCALPWPSDQFLRNGRVTLANISLPVDAQGGYIQPAAGGFDDLEGWSPMGPFVNYFADLDLTASQLPRLWDISSSTAKGATSILLDTVTGRPVAHWVELDHSTGNGTGTPADGRATIIWPASRLVDARRYILAFRQLVNMQGEPVAASSGFAALRDGVPTTNSALEAARARFEAMFTALEPLGFPRAELTLAWDFTTNTQASLTSRMLAMRDDAFARIAADGGVKYTIASVTKNPDANTTARIKGSFNVPCYLNDRAVPSLQSRLQLDASGKPVFQGYVPFDFEVIIPPSVAASVAAGGPAGRVVTYGHGLFGDHGEVEGGYLSAEAQQYGYVLAATDWIGLSEYDAPTVVVMLAETFTDFAIVPDRLHQGMLNTLVLNKLLTQSAFTTDPAVTFNGRSAISTNASEWFYTGNSQGGIMGTLYAAVTTEVSRSVLGVPGGPYALLLPRSTDFAQLFTLLKVRYPRSIDLMTVLALIQALWDRMDPAGWVGYITEPSPPLPGTPSHRAIWHYGLGDAQVTWLGAHALALSAGAVMFQSQPAVGNESLAHFSFVPDDAVLTTGNAIVGFDYGFPTVPFGECARPRKMGAPAAVVQSTLPPLIASPHPPPPTPPLALRSQQPALERHRRPRVPPAHAQRSGADGALLHHGRDQEFLRWRVHAAAPGRLRHLESDAGSKTPLEWRHRGRPAPPACVRGSAAPAAACVYLEGPAGARSNHCSWASGTVTGARAAGDMGQCRMAGWAHWSERGRAPRGLDEASSVSVRACPKRS